MTDTNLRKDLFDLKFDFLVWPNTERVTSPSVCQAVCCGDHEHCCPTGTTCDLATLTCVHRSGSTPMLRKDPAVMVMAVRYRVEMEEQEPLTEEEEEEGEGAGAVIPCDDHTSCKDSQTCCFIKSTKKWRCCPLLKVGASGPFKVPKQ